MEASDIRNLQEAYLEVYQELDEAEGSYGQTPKAHAAFNKLRFERASTNSRNFKGKKGGKTAAVDRASRHTGSSGGWHPDPGKKSPRPVGLTIRQKMTQNDRDFARQEREYYNSDDYDGGDFYGNPNPNGPRGGMPKGKKLTRQRKTGVSAESYDLILSHLLDEGYTNSIEGAEVILENMSEGWMESIVEELTGERRKIAVKKGFKHLATAREGSSTTKNRDSNRPLKRSGYGSSGGNRYGNPMGSLPGVAKVQMYPDKHRPDSDRGKGNKAKRRQGMKVKDNEDRYYWNSNSPDF